jgi:hypothetical protein
MNLLVEHGLAATIMEMVAEALRVDDGDLRKPREQSW